jgi:hypothetical protein
MVIKINERHFLVLAVVFRNKGLIHLALLTGPLKLVLCESDSYIKTFGRLSPLLANGQRPSHKISTRTSPVQSMKEHHTGTTLMTAPILC